MRNRSSNLDEILFDTAAASCTSNGPGLFPAQNVNFEAPKDRLFYFSINLMNTGFYTTTSRCAQLRLL